MSRQNSRQVKSKPRVKRFATIQEHSTKLVLQRLQAVAKVKYSISGMLMAILYQKQTHRHILLQTPTRPVLEFIILLVRQDMASALIGQNRKVAGRLLYARSSRQLPQAVTPDTASTHRRRTSPHLLLRLPAAEATDTSGLIH